MVFLFFKFRGGELEMNIKNVLLYTYVVTLLFVLAIYCYFGSIWFTDLDSSGEVTYPTECGHNLLYTTGKNMVRDWHFTILRRTQ